MVNNHLYHGKKTMSLIEIIITLFIFSISITVISDQVNRDIGGINGAKNHIAEIYQYEI